MSSQLYANPNIVTDLKDCDFYHTMDIPGYGHVNGMFDLRAGVNEYLGSVDLKGKRVLEIGPASGFLTFSMEQRGAEVVSCDLSPELSWDIVPFERERRNSFSEDRKNHIRRLNNGYWLAHKAYQSKARVVYSSAYTLPEEIGPVDVATFGCVLLHLRDPFLALQKALSLTQETVIVTELLPGWQQNYISKILKPEAMTRIERSWHRIFGRLLRPRLIFLPNFVRGAPNETWWCLSPGAIRNMIGVLGFEQTEVYYHWQIYNGARQMLYTIVGRRTVQSPPYI